MKSKFNFGKQSIINFFNDKGAKFIVKSMIQAFKDYYSENVQVLELNRSEHVMFLTIEDDQMVMELIKIYQGDYIETVKRKVGFISILDDIADCSDTFNLILKGLKAKSENFSEDLLKFQSIVTSLMENAETDSNAYIVFDENGKTLIHECCYAIDPALRLSIFGEINTKTIIKLTQ